MNPQDDPGIENALKFLEQAPLIGVIIAGLILFVVFFVKRLTKRK